jgi:ABC-2 type transport system permease protein
MSLVSLLRKEVAWSKRHVFVLLFLLIALPLFFAGTSFLFQDVIPRDVPVAVVAEDEAVSNVEMGVVRGGMSPYTRPVQIESYDEARRMLERESVYAIVTVPPDIRSGDTTFTLTIDGSVVPFQEPSEVIQDLIEVELGQIQGADISVDREVIGETKRLPEYLLPSFLMTLMIFFAFTYVPYNIGRDEVVLDRLRIETSMEQLVASKLVYLTALMLVPVLVFHVTSSFYRYDIASFAPGGVFVLLLTFALLSTVSATVSILTRFSGAGQFFNLLVMLGLIALSGLAFPLGFFSPLRTQIAQLLPTHYAMVVVRSLMLKESAITMFADWIGMLVGLWLLSLVGLKGAIVYYRRTA